MSEKKPFFSVVIPLYNKQSHVRETIETVLNQTFQDFEIVVVNDGSTDESAKVVESIKDDRIRFIEQENAGVSVARNKGIQEAMAKYIVFLDADDLWLPEFLQTIYELIQKCPDVGLYATAYKKRKIDGKEVHINIKALPSKEYIGIIPNYFKSIVQGDNLVWTSAICIPKKIFCDNDIWFPLGEKYGEDQYVWARVAMQYELAYDTKACAVYQTEAENNTISAILKEKEPHNSILMLKEFRENILDEEKLRYFDKYLEKSIVSFILKNILNNHKLVAIRQMNQYAISIKLQSKLFLLILIPTSLYGFLKQFKKLLRGV